MGRHSLKLISGDEESGSDHKKGDAAVLQWLRRWRERDRHLARPRSLDHVDPLEELICVVNEAQDRDARDERRLYDPELGERPLFFQRRRRE
jgi:hypothetical protein